MATENATNPAAGLYAVKCDDCKCEVRRTNSLRESAAGARCAVCRPVRAGHLAGCSATSCDPRCAGAVAAAVTFTPWVRTRTERGVEYASVASAGRERRYLYVMPSPAGGYRARVKTSYAATLASEKVLRTLAEAKQWADEQAEWQLRRIAA